MKRRIALLLIPVMIVLSACGSSSAETTANVQESEQEVTSSESETEATEAKEEASAQKSESTESSQSIEVDENLLTVDMTLPSSFTGEMTQEDIDAYVKEQGMISGKLNDDGSVTYTMTKGKHKELLDETKKSFDEQLANMVGSEDYPWFTDIKANDNYTDFKITTTSTDPGLQESVTVYTFYFIGGFYSAVSGEDVDNVHVELINNESGEVVLSADSKDMANNN